MIDSVDSLRHEHSLLLVGHGVSMFPGNVAQSRNHAQTLRNLAVHGSVHVVQQIQCFGD